MLQLGLQCNVLLLFVSNADFQTIGRRPRVEPSLTTYFLVANKLLKLCRAAHNHRAVCNIRGLDHLTVDSVIINDALLGLPLHRKPSLGSAPVAASYKLTDH